jgi:hypothetical protein
MTCKDCGHAVSMNKICEKPLQSASDILRHMAGHNASHSFASVGPVTRPEMEIVPIVELARGLGVPARVDRSDSPIPNQVRGDQSADSPDSPQTN